MYTTFSNVHENYHYVYSDSALLDRITALRAP